MRVENNVLPTVVAIFSHSRDQSGGDDPALGLTAFSAEWDRQFANLPQFDKESIVANPMSDAAQRLHGAVEAALQSKDGIDADAQ